MQNPWETEVRSTVPSLGELTETAVATRLGELATDDNSSTFCSGGDLELTRAIDIIYQQSPGELGKHERQNTFRAGRITLPGADEDSLSELIGISTCETDKYHSIYQVDNGSFFTSFQLCSTTILNEIESLMQPGKVIRADIDKLNIHTARNCLKQACVGPDGDVPASRVPSKSDHEKQAYRGSDKGEFGKLVVCLPARFTGGPLILYHHGNKMEYQWANSSTPKSPVVHWAAFFNGTKHQLLPVTSGFCITLTYDLYSAEQRLTSLPSGNAFCQMFDQMMIHPHFMRHGGLLGFQCQHAYQYTELNHEERLPLLLKGADYVVYSAAKAMGLAVVVRPLVQGYKHWYLMAEFANDCGYHDACLDGDDADNLVALVKPINVEMQALGACIGAVGESDGPKRWPHPVTWCTALKPKQVAGYYLGPLGNVHYLYRAPVIVMEFPGWSEPGRKGVATRGKQSAKLEKRVYFWLQDWCKEGEDTEFEWLIERSDW